MDFLLVAVGQVWPMGTTLLRSSKTSTNKYYNGILDCGTSAPKICGHLNTENKLSEVCIARQCRCYRGKHISSSMSVSRPLSFVVGDVEVTCIKTLLIA